MDSELVKTGLLFRGKEDNYVVVFGVGEVNGSKYLVSIYRDVDNYLLSDQDGVEIEAYSPTLLCEIDLWPKHYLIRFNPEFIQMSYSVVEVSNFKWELDIMNGQRHPKELAEAIEFAITQGVQHFKLNLY